MTPDERAALRALADAATPGPWEQRVAPREGYDAEAKVEYLRGTVDDNGEPLSLLISEPVDRPGLAYVVPALTGDGPRARDNAAFIAAARTAVPALLDALDAAEDRCTGCGQPWQGCVTAPNRGGIKCCPDCSHPIEDLAWNGLARERDDARAALDRVRAACAEYVEWLHEDHGTPETWPTGTVHTALVPVPEILRAIEGES